MKFFKYFKRHKHKYKLNGWSSVKCIHCGKVSYNSKDYTDAYDSMIEKRTESMLKAGFNEDSVFTDNSKISQ